MSMASKEESEAARQKQKENKTENGGLWYPTGRQACKAKKILRSVPLISAVGRP